MPGVDKSVVLVTGATDGIGLHVAQVLVSMGAQVILHGRNPQRLAAALAEVRKRGDPRRVVGMVADFTSLEQTVAMAEALNAKLTRLDILINNAGCFNAERHMTDDGLESTFAVNHLATYLLSVRLLDLLARSGSGRIVNTTSMIHAKKLDLQNLQGERSYHPYEAYYQSQLCNIMFTMGYAQEAKERGVTINCLHPGVAATKLLAAGWGGGMPVARAARNTVILATAEHLRAITGAYFLHDTLAHPETGAMDRDMQEKLLRYDAKIVGRFRPRKRS